MRLQASADQVRQLHPLEQADRRKPPQAGREDSHASHLLTERYDYLSSQVIPLPLFRLRVTQAHITHPFPLLPSRNCPAKAPTIRVRFP